MTIGSPSLARIARSRLNRSAWNWQGPKGIEPLSFGGAMDYAIELVFAVMTVVVIVEFAVVMVGLFGSSRRGRSDHKHVR